MEEIIRPHPVGSGADRRALPRALYHRLRARPAGASGCHHLSWPAHHARHRHFPFAGLVSAGTIADLSGFILVWKNTDEGEPENSAVIFYHCADLDIHFLRASWRRPMGQPPLPLHLPGLDGFPGRLVVGRNAGKTVPLALAFAACWKLSISAFLFSGISADIIALFKRMDFWPMMRLLRGYRHGHHPWRIALRPDLQ